MASARSNPDRIIRAMATPSKRVPPSKGKQSPKLPSAAPESGSKPFLRFYHSAALRKKTLSLLSIIEQAQDAAAHRDALADLVVELTNAGLDYYFMKQLKLAKPGFLVEQSANLGMAGAQQSHGLRHPPGHRPHGQSATALRVRLHSATHALSLRPFSSSSLQVPSNPSLHPNRYSRFRLL